MKLISIFKGVEAFYAVKFVSLPFESIQRSLNRSFHVSWLVQGFFCILPDYMGSKWEDDVNGE
jgi:hypothetical protein